MVEYLWGGPGGGGLMLIQACLLKLIHARNLEDEFPRCVFKEIHKYMRREGGGGRGGRVGGGGGDKPPSELPSDHHHLPLGSTD